MANTYKNIVITPNIGNTSDPKIQFSGGNTTANTDINLVVYPNSNGTLSFEGSAGQLFSITNDLSNSLFAVSDVSGIPSLEVFANGLVSAIPFGGNVVFGNSSVSVLVNSSAVVGNTVGVHTGNVSATTISGNLTGNVAAITITGNLTGNVAATTITGNLTGNVLATTVNATTINAATFQVGTAFTANATVVNAVSYYSGTLLVANTTVINATHLGGTAAAGYQTTAGLSANVATLTSNNSTFMNGNTVVTVMESLRANRSLSGGGTITIDASYNVLWSSRFIVISNGRGTHFSTAGFFDITCPTSGTITGVGGATNKTATAAGIPLTSWDALYYILPIGSNNTSVAANFRVANYTSDVEIPSTWVLICIRNGDTGQVHFNNGVTLTTGQSYNSVSFNTAVAPLANNSTNLNGQAASYYTNATNITTGTLPYAQIPANVINTTAAFTRTGVTTFSANVVLGSSGLSANGGFGTAGQVLHSNGTATYWATDDQGVTSVATGNGMTGGTITATGTVSVLANTGIVANATGLYVNATYIGTLSANNTTYVNGKTEGNLNVNNATQLATARTLTIGSTGKSFNGTTNLSWSTTEMGVEYQAPLGIPRVNLGDPTVREMALFDGQFNNKTELFDINNLFFETSTDNVTWSTYSVSDAQKRLFLTGDSNASIAIMNGTAYFRVRLKATNYVYLNALYLYHTNGGHSTQVQVFRKAFGSTTWVQHTNSTVSTGSWPGHLYLPFSTIAWHPSTADDEVYFLFIPTWNPSWPAQNFVLHKFQLWGGYPAGKRTIYATNEYGDVTFPANVAAIALNGNTSGTHTGAIVLGASSLSANGITGTAGQVLHSNGTATYWAADDQGVTSVASGNGITGGTITSTGTLSAVAGTGTVVNTTGIHVNATYIGTLSANNTTYVNGKTEGNLNVNNATTATTASQIDGIDFYNGNSTNPVVGPDNLTNNGIAYVSSISLLGQSDGALRSQAYSTSWVHQIYGDYRTGQIALRGKNNGTWQSWRVVLDSSNFTSYAPNTSGGSATGTWGISITGTSNNATNLGGTAASGYQTTAGLSANIAAYLPTYTGVVNGSSHAVGTAFTANSTVVNAVSYYSGTLLVANSTVINATHLAGKTEGNLNVNNAIYAGSSFTNAFTVGTGTYFVSNGNVGVGNATPIDKLSVNGTTYLGANVSIPTATEIRAGNTTVFSIYSDAGVYAADTTTYASHGPDQSTFDSLTGQLQITADSLTMSGLGAGANVAYLYPNYLSVGNATILATLSSSNLSIYSATAGSYANLTATTLTIGSSVVNSTAHTIGTAFIANTLGVYHTGTVNAASHTVGTAFTANATVVNAVSYYSGTLLVANSTVINATHLGGQQSSYYTNATNITTGTLPYAQIPANVINTTAEFTRTGITTFSANVVLGSSGLSANGGFGTAGQVLHSNGSATYWAADDNAGGTVTSVVGGTGLTGGTITTTGTLSVNAAYIATIGAATAVTLTSNQSNWTAGGVISAVVGLLSWKNYSNNHVIFDASNGTSPSGGAVNNGNAQVPWTGTYPTLMGWNGANTYGVRVDSARVADTVGANTRITVGTTAPGSPATGDLWVDTN